MSEATRRGKVLRALSLYSADCLELLKNALDQAQARQPETTFKSRYHVESSSSDDNKEAETDEDSPSSDEAESPVTSDADDYAAPEKVATNENGLNEGKKKKPPPRPSKKSSKFHAPDERQRQILMKKHGDSVHCATFPTNQPTASYLLEVPLSLLSKEQRMGNNNICQSFTSLSESMQQQSLATTVVLFLRSGRFAGAVFCGDTCLTHTSSQRYTVRRGQGKAQSTQDASRRPKSMGAQLRRQGEQDLKEDVVQTLESWKTPHLDRAALILVSCPKTMCKVLFEDTAIDKDDARIRRVPLDLGRPSFESVQTIYNVMTTVLVRELIESADAGEGAESSVVAAEEEEAVANGAAASPENPAAAEESHAPPPDLSPLHIAAMDGNLEKLLEILERADPEQVNAVAGEEWSTPLHLAAAAGAEECVYQLLTTGRADPTIWDVRTRPPTFLATNDKVRNAFRRARVTLGEEYCDWDGAAKVGPALTEDLIQQRKDKEAEKRRKKKARQKEKKARERAQAEAMENEKLAQEEKQKQEEAARRIRGGLDPKISTAPNQCDFCQKVCKGKRRSQMFQRLEYVYCSTDCVQKHKRELMASAALNRFGSS